MFHGLNKKLQQRLPSKRGPAVAEQQQLSETWRHGAQPLASPRASSVEAPGTAGASPPRRETSGEKQTSYPCGGVEAFGAVGAGGGDVVCAGGSDVGGPCVGPRAGPDRSQPRTVNAATARSVRFRIGPQRITRAERDGYRAGPTWADYELE